MYEEANSVPADDLAPEHLQTVDKYLPYHCI